MEKTKRTRKVRHRGRDSQVLIYLGKQFRFFINESDWKVLPMAAIIAGLVSMVIRKQFFVTMEGSLMGGFALTCMAIWNGCFNSIQSICRERAIIKREHRSGLHMTSYVIAHMIYQFLLCAAQTGLSLYVMMVVGVQFPAEGFMTRWMILDLGITLLLVAYASDMLSLFISSISHTTTGAMTVMPFVLIFQLVFSGGVIPLPEWSQKLSNFTISNYGIHAIAAQSNYNERPMVTLWKTVDGMRNTEVGGTFTLGELVDLLDSPTAKAWLDTEIETPDWLKEKTEGLTDGQAEALTEGQAEEPADSKLTLGMIAGLIRETNWIQEHRDYTFKATITVGELLNLFDEEKVKTVLQEATAAASRKPEYDCTKDNILRNWFALMAFVLLFALLSVISLELIDHDKR